MRRHFRLSPYAFRLATLPRPDQGKVGDIAHVGLNAGTQQFFGIVQVDYMRRNAQIVLMGLVNNGTVRFRAQLFV